VPAVIGLVVIGVPAARLLNEDTVSPGWLGLVVFLILGVCVVFLARSLRHQLAKVPKSFDPPAADAEPADVEPADVGPADVEPAEVEEGPAPPG
jgi:hypothetical protein